LRWLARQAGGTFTRRDAYRALRGLAQKPDDADPALQLLERLAIIRPAGGGNRTGPGRKPSEAFEVNPRWDRGRNGHNGRN
jgi:hypothetical protein